MRRIESSTPQTDDQIRYVSPTITSLREEEVLDQVGPAQAYAGNVPFGF
jgi:hypothetical protein